MSLRCRSRAQKRRAGRSKSIVYSVELVYDAMKSDGSEDRCRKIADSTYELPVMLAGVEQFCTVKSFGESWGNPYPRSSGVNPVATLFRPLESSPRPQK